MTETPCTDCGKTGTTMFGQAMHDRDCPKWTNPFAVALTLPVTGAWVIDPAMTGACLRHPDAPVIGGVCGACTQHPAVDAHRAARSLYEAGVQADGDDVVTTELRFDIQKLMDAVLRAPRPAPQHPDLDRRDRYAAAIRRQIKLLTIPSTIPGGAPSFGATEHDLADAVLAERDDEHAELGEQLDAAGATIAERTVEANRLREELAQARAERDAALRLAGVWSDAPDPLVRHAAADLLSAIVGARPAATEATDPTTCGATGSGFFSRSLGPCLKTPNHASPWHRGASGAEWADHTTETAPGPDPCSGCRLAPCGACHTLPAPRLLDCGLCYEENGEEVHPHPECTQGGSVSTVAHAIARAIHRYDYEHGLSGNDLPGAHQYGEADAVLTALEEYLSLGEEAWCTACLRRWDSRHHDCEEIPQYLQTRAERDQLQRAVDGLRRLNDLTADGSSRVHAREHARDNLALLNGILGEPVTVPTTSKASSAREELLNLMATWGLTTGRGSREHADRILERRDRETAETSAGAFAREVAAQLELIGEQHHPAMKDSPTRIRSRRASFAALARDWGRHVRSQFDARGPQYDRQDWTSILLEAVYDLLSEDVPRRRRRHLAIVAALCSAWAADTDSRTTQRAEGLDNPATFTKLGESGS
ncbi:MAG: hypothetical protein HOY79_33720 [Streptomyces sp.]|nr:hypothetical protein [Streptomyces sp.]NUS11348.1 hypothetical protein [Streptomyces sp.]NUS23376.1 hypothetical protein [Streptomyces sp.]